MAVLLASIPIGGSRNALKPWAASLCAVRGTCVSDDHTPYTPMACAELCLDVSRPENAGR